MHVWGNKNQVRKKTLNYTYLIPKLEAEKRTYFYYVLHCFYFYLVAYNP